FEGQIICITRARTRRGVAEMCSLQGGVTRATRVEGEVGQPSLIRSARQLSLAGSDCSEAWPLSQPWLSAAGRGCPAAHDHYPQGAVEVGRFRCCAKAPVRASHAPSIRRKTGPEPGEIEISRPAGNAGASMTSHSEDLQSAALAYHRLP